MFGQAESRLPKKNLSFTPGFNRVIRSPRTETTVSTVYSGSTPQTVKTVL